MSVDANAGYSSEEGLVGDFYLNPSEQRALIKADDSDLLGMYFEEIALPNLLTWKDEALLSQKAMARLKALNQLELLGNSTDEDELIELQRIVAEGNEAVGILVSHNTRLVVYFAQKYRGRGVPFEDLIQEGNIGLIRGARKFKYTHGTRFSTYAGWWIRQAIGRAVYDTSRAIRIPVYVQEVLTKMAKQRQRFISINSREPQNSELAQMLDLPIEEIEKYLKYEQIVTISLDEPLNDEEESTTLSDYLDDPYASEMFEVPDYDAIRREILDLIHSSLSKRQANVLILRYGLNEGESPHTLEEIGKILGVTRERVRQIEKRGIDFLKNDKSVGGKLLEFLSDFEQ